MTRTVHITELRDFQAVTVRCHACRTTITFPLAAELPVIVHCQGCREHVDLKAAYALVGALRQAQATPFKGFDIEFETTERQA
jgi:hypothetical protein